MHCKSRKAGKSRESYMRQLSSKGGRAHQRPDGPLCLRSHRRSQANGFPTTGAFSARSPREQSARAPHHQHCRCRSVSPALAQAVESLPVRNGPLKGQGFFSPRLSQRALHASATLGKQLRHPFAPPSVLQRVAIGLRVEGTWPGAVLAQLLPAAAAKCLPTAAAEKSRQSWWQSCGSKLSS